MLQLEKRSRHQTALTVKFTAGEEYWQQTWPCIMYWRYGKLEGRFLTQSVTFTQTHTVKSLLTNKGVSLLLVFY